MFKMTDVLSQLKDFKKGGHQRHPQLDLESEGGGDGGACQPTVQVSVLLCSCQLLQGPELMALCPNIPCDGSCLPAALVVCNTVLNQVISFQRSRWFSRGIGLQSPALWSPTICFLLSAGIHDAAALLQQSNCLLLFSTEASIPLVRLGYNSKKYFKRRHISFLILFWVTIGIGLHVLVLKKHIGFLMWSGSAAPYPSSVWNTVSAPVSSDWSAQTCLTRHCKQQVQSS